MRFQRITVFGPKFKFWCDLFAICSDLACDLGACFFSGTNIKLHPQARTGAPAKLADLPAGVSTSAGSQENICTCQKRGQPVLLIQPHTFYVERGDRPAPACL